MQVAGDPQDPGKVTIDKKCGQGLYIHNLRLNRKN